jgi:myo-inositol-1-phosphate synthase
MADKRVGLWLVGAGGGVSGTTALGLAALARNLTPETGLVTALPALAGLALDPAAAFVVGGHDIRQTNFARSVAELHARSNVFAAPLLDACRGQLDEWSANIRPGVVYRPDGVIRALADRPDVVAADSPLDAIDRIRRDLDQFRTRHRLDRVVVLNAASTEPPFAARPEHAALAELTAALGGPVLPTSGQYAYASLLAGCGYVNLTPSFGADCPALEELAVTSGVPVGGKDLKTGETLLKSVLAPLFARRNLKVLSWVGHNILGNRDGQVLADPDHKASKVKSKDALLAELLGYRPQTLVSIEHVESLDDWKTAWDHVHFEGFLGVKMSLQFTWQGCDSALAAPLAIDLARLALHAHRDGRAGVRPEWAAFFKSPAGTADHDFARQHDRLVPP